MEKKFDIKKFMSNNAIIILIALLALAVGFSTENFFSGNNLKNLIANVSPRFIIACGVSGCLITKGTDLSAGRQVGLAACLSAMLLQSVDYAARMIPGLPDIPWFLAMLIVMAVMAVFGAINGCVIAYLKVPPFIATLGMQTIVYGLCSVITGNQPMGGFKSSYSNVQERCRPHMCRQGGIYLIHHPRQCRRTLLSAHSRRTSAYCLCRIRHRKAR